MNLNILKTFLVISETKNLTKASELLNYSQSTVSSHIVKLEKQLDVKLFYRKKYGMELTEEGLTYVKYAKLILDSNNEYKKEIKGLYNKTVNISINMQESQYLYRYYHKISLWLKKHPYVNLKFKSAHSNFYIKKEIENFRSDICLITDENIVTINLTSIPISKEKLIFITSNQLKEFKIEDLNNHTLLVTEKGCSYREQVERILYKYNLEPTQIVEFIGIESLKKHILSTCGIALLPEFIVEEEIKNKKLFPIDIDIKLPILETNLLFNPKSNKKALNSLINQVFLNK